MTVAQPQDVPSRMWILLGAFHIAVWTIAGLLVDYSGHRRSDGLFQIQWVANFVPWILLGTSY
jgi:hypothetical protein